MLSRFSRLLVLVPLSSLTSLMDDVLDDVALNVELKVSGQSNFKTVNLASAREEVGRAWWVEAGKEGVLDAADVDVGTDAEAGAPAEPVFEDMESGRGDTSTKRFIGESGSKVVVSVSRASLVE